MAINAYQYVRSDCWEILKANSVFNIAKICYNLMDYVFMAVLKTIIRVYHYVSKNAQIIKY